KLASPSCDAPAELGALVVGAAGAGAPKEAIDGNAAGVAGVGRLDGMVKPGRAAGNCETGSADPGDGNRCAAGEGVGIPGCTGPIGSLDIAGGEAVNEQPSNEPGRFPADPSRPVGAAGSIDAASDVGTPSGFNDSL